ncbi:MAG: hypothetical protein QMD14_01270 [Candidatus Aenigmarchaeota archaeon]|nr:hypothetical protein [Candidatus Aenigmarchaeota archaeon]
MSLKVRELLRMFNLLEQTTHEDREEIDREIELRTGVYCDDAIENGLISKGEFLEIVKEVLKRKRKKKEAVAV